MQIENSQGDSAAEISDDIALAVEALTELKNSHGQVGFHPQEHDFQQQQGDTLLAKVRTNSLIDNAVKVYKKSKNQYPKFRRGAEMVERKALIPMVKRLEERRSQKRLLENTHRMNDRNDVLELQEIETENEIDVESEGGDSKIAHIASDRETRKRRSKKQKISNAIAKSKSNLKGYQLNMSIESKKRLVTCLHLLKLANYQLSNRVSFLQDLVHKEQQLRGGRIRENIGRRIKVRGEKRPDDADIAAKDRDNGERKENDEYDENEKGESNGDEDEPEDEDEDECEDGDKDRYYDASDNLHEQSDAVKMEIVGTVKKVYSLVSKFTGNSLPEPARTQVRESLLKLPSNWTSSMNSENLSKYTNSKRLSRNGKVLILAKESLGMVHNVMDVVDNTLGKAEEWVKQKQEIKELLKEQYLSSKLRDVVRTPTSEEGKIK
ncbi:LAME_0G14708g1_1 [Lachancea meyersii CBS 8951]|uniref:LAME_0G14708g1_1 n=1 Tax=Lachancea meyersii CBS 8951 TaxID=1266667 RepID=A0A1G4KAL0_9SACH|nr:LAME_0G14708g1_1 [Lachancea meyersii CBS 8951]